MNLDELLTRFASNNGIDKPAQADGRYTIPMEGVKVFCSEASGVLTLIG